MKYAVIIADGAADKPIAALGGRTPLEAAVTPNLDAITRRGRLGTACTTPTGFEAGSDVCSMSLLGYDPAKSHTGRAPLEAAALGIELAATDWIFRVNFVTVREDGVMLDHSAGAISSEEGATLGRSLAAHWREREPALARDLTLTPGVSYRNILVDRGGPAAGRDYKYVRTTPPHEIPGRPWREHAPREAPGDPGAVQGAALLNRLMELSAEVLPSHPVNQARAARGQRPANLAWPWGQGTRPAMPSFTERFGLRGAMITPVDLLAGIAALIGWQRIDVPGVTSYHDNDYAAQGRAACEALDRFDIVCCHVEAPDEASHQGDPATKVAAIEAIDRHVVGPIVAKLEEVGEEAGWRVLVMPDHYTLVSTRRHDPTPPPFVVAGTGIGATGAQRFTEGAAAASGRRIDPGHSLMEWLLRSDLKAAGTLRQ